MYSITSLTNKKLMLMPLIDNPIAYNPSNKIVGFKALKDHYVNNSNF